MWRQVPGMMMSWVSLAADCQSAMSVAPGSCIEELIQDISRHGTPGTILRINAFPKKLEAYITVGADPGKRKLCMQ
eukprot:900685-Pelagomonas_calceolata.AAC.5